MDLPTKNYQAENIPQGAFWKKLKNSKILALFCMNDLLSLFDTSFDSIILILKKFQLGW